MLRINVMTTGIRNTLAQRRWRDRNPDKSREIRLESNRAWRSRSTETDRDRNNKSSYTYRKNHPDRCRATDRRQRAMRAKAEGSFSDKEFKALGNICVCCGLSAEELLLVKRRLVPDHVVPLSRGGTNYIGNIQPLCHGKGGCNNVKGVKHTDYRG